MNYYKARQQATLPLVVFDLVATSLAQLQALGLDADPLVVDEDNLPLTTGSICHKKIFNGMLIDRDAAEINQAIANANEAKTIAQNEAKTEAIKVQEFTYNGNTFPMDETSQKRYEAVFSLPDADTDFQTKTGVVTVATADIAGMKTAYYQALRTATNP